MAAPIPIILNPAARSTQAAIREKAICELSPTPEVIVTQGRGQATQIAERLAREGHPVVVAAGGDGTMNEVLQGICRVNASRRAGEEHTALGVLPMGTMNVFALEVGMPSGNLAACWQKITTSPVREIDLWQANEHYFVQLAGVGLDAEIIQQTPWERKKKFGPLGYVISAMQVLTREPPVISVHIPGSHSLHGSLVLMGAGKHYGGPVRVFPNASNQDGLLDVLVFRQIRSWEFAQLVSAIITKGYEPYEDIDYLQVREFTVTSDRPVPTEVDGELVADTTPITFKPSPFRLKVAC